MGSKDREFAKKIRAKQEYQVRIGDYENNLDSLRLIVKNMGKSFRDTIANIEADFRAALERIEALEKKDATELVLNIDNVDEYIKQAIFKYRQVGRVQAKYIVCDAIGYALLCASAVKNHNCKPGRVRQYMGLTPVVIDKPGFEIVPEPIDYFQVTAERN